jgi:hypothetical protein
MSQTTAFKIAAGLTAGLGLAWSSTMAPAAFAAPQDMAPPAAAPTAPVAPAEPAPARVLLMSDGRVIQGAILETDDGYVVKTSFGPLRFRRRDVVRTFSGIPDVYAYKRTVVPENDPGERLKLAQWCVGQKMYAEAQAELQLVLAYSPGLKQAEQMQHMLQAKLAVPADNAVMLSGATSEQLNPGRDTIPISNGADPPAPLSANVLRELRDEYRKNPRSNEYPVIFDLPPQQAVQRYREFATFIHPALQTHCAGCHNEQSDSSFRLIQTRVRRDMSNDLVVRANLDAALQLVDPAQPDASRLLTSSIMPHPPTNRPVLTGPNSRTYQQFAAWVQNVSAAGGTPTSDRSVAKTTAPGEPSVSPNLPPQPADGGGFAVDRAGAARAPSGPPATTSPANPPVLRAAPPLPTPVVHFPPAPAQVIEPTPAGQLVPESVDDQPRSTPSDSAFRITSPQDVVKAAQASRTANPAPAGTGATVPSQSVSFDPMHPVDWTGATPGTTSPTASDGAATSTKSATETARTKKSVKIRRDVLQKFMTPGGAPQP